MEAYTKCAITKKTDRLIAFAGIAQSYAHGLGRSLDDYVAGIWRQEFLSSLCFSATRSESIHRPDEYHAPSWSWASLEGPITFLEFDVPSDKKVPLCSIVNTNVIRQYEAHQGGEVKGAVLHIKGQLVQWILGSQAPKWPRDMKIEEIEPWLPNDLKRRTVFDEGYLASGAKSWHPMVSYLEHPKGQTDQRKEGVVDGAVRKSIRSESPDELSERLRLFLLPLQRLNIVSKLGIVASAIVQCLVLCQTLDDSFAGSDIYQRVGYFSWRTSEVNLDHLDGIPEREIYII